jgi:Tol biopolymer transport system component
MRWILPALLALVVLTGGGDAGTRNVLPGYDLYPVVSPDGRWLLFQRICCSSRYTPPQYWLFIARADGSAVRELVPMTGSLRVLWTPEGLVQVTSPYPEGPTSLLRPDDGSVVRRLPIAPSAWSRDGRWVAYADYRPDSVGLVVAAPDGSSSRRLVSVPAGRWIEVGSFSPDSNRITYAVGGSPRASSEVIRLDGNDRTVLREAGIVSPGKWSPDGTALVLTAQKRYDSRIYVVGVDGSNASAIAPGFQGEPVGDWITYVRKTQTGKRAVFELMIVRPSGTHRRRVVRTGGPWTATWLADGHHVLTLGYGACRRGGIIEIDVFARTVKQLTNRCRIEGTPRADTIRGTPLRDLIDGLGGGDKIVGGGGDDRISGGSGNDTISSRDRFRDTVRCGPGVDRVVADYRDRVDRDCENVSR